MEIGYMRRSEEEEPFVSSHRLHNAAGSMASEEGLIEDLDSLHDTPPDLQIVRQTGTQKNNKKTAKKSSKVRKLSQIGDPGGHQSSTKLQLVLNFLHPGPQMGQESSRGP